MTKINYKNLINQYAQDLKKLQSNNLFRVIENIDSTNSFLVNKKSKNIPEQKLISFACNDYLSLSNHPILKKSAINAVEKYGVGARASRFITGNSSLYSELESQIAKFYNCDDSLVFSSGYACAIGIISSVVGDGDLIVADKLIHSCLLDGAKLSGAKLIRFKHNDIDHCQKILAENRPNFQKCLIITETVFSMDGDIGKIKELLNLAKNFNAILLSDDAHGLGENIISNPIHLQMGTLSKALGSLGGFVAGNKILIEYIRQFARSLKYSTALPPAILASSIEALKLMKKTNLAQKSLKNAQYFCKLMGMPICQSSIVVIVIGDNKKVLKIAEMVRKKGFIIAPIRYPTVPKNQSRLRLTFSSAHKKAHIKKLAGILKEIT
ncbi:MAG: aminotransferase class I/II-fold pyridoxal phosphate-dependent enzyme [Proteobacteria bacterium]|nr:aminotransferase class I/II-fold pyridoxal phosphate-dependent enzyme [Pseudomonadota bacterium]NCA27860.1 aminotransferase class I/II-fold pyridoxal phosphate-dependent enzyme [Pseudomonadota bacterium]